MKVCVIGAGIAGLSCTHELAASNIDFDCYEKRDFLGGLWYYSDTESSVYKNCKQNHPRDRMGLNDVSIDHINDDYLNHVDYLAYLKQFDSPDIRYNSAVQKVCYNPTERIWRVTVNGQIKLYSYVVVCSGHYTDPYIPPLYENFSGQLLHSKDYKKPEYFSGKRVLVVGGGSSGVQIASDLVGSAKKIALSMRTVPHILPRYVKQQVLLEFYQSVKHLSEQEIVSALRNSGIDQSLYDIPKPEQGLLTGSTVPICDNIFGYVKAQKIQILPAADKVCKLNVAFGDKKLEFDSVILATGYRLSFPFFDFVIDYGDNIDFMINKQWPGLFFVGMLQPVGPVPPLLRAQSSLISKLIRAESVSYPISNRWIGKSHRVLLNDYIVHLKENYTA